MIVITGASDGLGQELARLYVDDGKRVVGLSRSVCIAGVEHIPTDLADAAQIGAAAKQISGDDETLEALINCAGVLSVEKIEHLTLDTVSNVLDVNLRAPMLLTGALMEKIKRDGADIVNVSSTVGHKAYADQAAYGASKWGIRGFSLNLQLELKDYPSRVISFCPGGFDTNIFMKAAGYDNSVTKGPLMQPRDVAHLLKQLLELPKNMEISEVVVNRKQVRV